MLTALNVANMMKLKRKEFAHNALKGTNYQIKKFAFIQEMKV